jgi:hypothetical protein
MMDGYPSTSKSFYECTVVAQGEGQLSHNTAHVSLLYDKIVNCGMRFITKTIFQEKCLYYYSYTQFLLKSYPRISFSAHLLP